MAFDGSMDLKTADYYGRRAGELASAYTRGGGGAASYFPLAFPSGSRILDVGCGMGRDLHALLDAGYDATGIDGSEAMLTEARRRYPAVCDRIAMDTLPCLESISNAAFDGALCWAVLMHLLQEHLFDTVFNLRRVLRPGGRLLISTPLEGPEIDPDTNHDPDGRLFNGVTPENFQFLFEKVGFKLLDRWDTEDSLERPNRRWATQLFVLQGSGSRSLDKIEGILNRDKKDATYKPALFRALAELATTSYHAAAWLPEGQVAVPLELIADKWIEYFWPLFESEIFISQKHGEKRECRKPVAFHAGRNRIEQ